MENPDLVLQETGKSQSPSHSIPTECGSRQVIQVSPNHLNRMVSPPRGLSDDMQQLASTAVRPVFNKVEQLTSV